MNGKVDKGFPDVLFVIKHYQLASAYTSASGNAHGFKSTEMKLSNPVKTIAGEQVEYIPVGVTKATTYSAGVSISYFNSDTDVEYCFGTRNGSSSSDTTRPIMDVVYAPDYLVEVGTDTTGKPFKKLKFSATASSVAKTASIKVTATQLGYYVPEGYQVFSVTWASGSTSNVQIINFDPFEPDCMLQIRNSTSGSVSVTPILEVVFIRKDFAEKIS